MNRQTGFTPSRKVRKGRKERQRPLLGGSLRLGVLARAVLVFPDTICKNSGNKAKKSLKIKEGSFRMNSNQADLEFQTRVLNARLKPPRILPIRGARPHCQGFDGQLNRGALRIATNSKIVGTNSINFFRISESFKKRTENELKTNSYLRRKQYIQDAKYTKSRGWRRRCF